MWGGVGSNQSVSHSIHVCTHAIQHAKTLAARRSTHFVLLNLVLAIVVAALILLLLVLLLLLLLLPAHRAGC